MFEKFITKFSVIILGMVIGLCGCAATQTAISHKDLDVQTKMSSSIFLNPLANVSERKVYVEFRNTSDKQNFDEFGKLLKIEFKEKGCVVVDDPNKAHYLLQCNLRAVTKADPSAAEQVLGAGYQGIGAGATAGAMIGGATQNTITGSAYGAGIGGLVGGLASTVANSAVKNVTFMGVTDVKLSEKTEIDEWKSHETRVVSTANKVNLKFEEAEPVIRKELIHSLANLI